MSDETTPRRELADWLRDAYAGGAAGCPPPKAYLADEMAALTAEERSRLEAHAASCPACSAERELARAFDAGETGAAAEDVDFITARLRREAAPLATPAAAPAKPAEPARTGMPSGARVVPFRGRTAAARTWVRFAAAAVLVVAAGLTVRTFYARPPALPAPPPGGVVRGGEVELVAPVAEVAEPPRELQWLHVAGATGYRVRLLAVDDTVLWETKAGRPPVLLPAEVTATLQRGVSYTWSVEALTADGATLARSQPARFRIRPLPEASEAEEDTP